LKKGKLILLGPAHPYRGGIAAFNHQLAYSFLKNNWQVDLWTYTFQYPSLLFPGKDQLTNDAPPKELNIQRKLHTLNPLNWRKIGKEIAHQKPDLVIGQYWMPYIALSLSNYLKHAKKNLPNLTTATVVHNLIPHESKPGDAYWTKKMMHESDYYLSLSDQVKSDMIEVNSEARIIPLFHPIYDHYGAPLEMETAKQHCCLSASNDYILFFGLIRAYKGLDLLIEAFKKVVEEYPNKKLLVVGESYEDLNKYLNMIAKLGLKDAVSFVDQYIPSDQIKYYFSAAELVVLPYKTATQSGITQIGLHFEKPIIATNVGGLHEVVHQGINGMLTAPDAIEISNAILEFYKHGLAQKFIAGSKKMKADLSWDNFYKQFIEKLNSEV